MPAPPTGALRRADPTALAERRAFAAADHDFASLAGRSGVILDRPARRGVRLLAAPTTALPDDTLDALLAWRLGQYLLTGFYDPDRIAAAGSVREPREAVHPGDLHFFAVGDEGDLLAYLTFKQPSDVAPGALYRDRDRPLFSCEEVHSRAWQNSVTGVDEVELASCWELGRFLKDQRRPTDTLGFRAVLELGLAAARLVRSPAHRGRFRLLTGDLDPEVALKSLRFFFVPVAGFAPHYAELPEGHLLAPRYRDHPTAPFLIDLDDIDNATYIRWADIDLALGREDEVAAMRMLALRQFVRVKESTLKRPLLPPGDSPYPVDALTSASSREASATMWRNAERGAIPWRALLLGPGDPLPTDRVVWVVDGFVQALVTVPQQAHLAGLGPEVVFLPQAPSMNELLSLQAATPVRALTTEREHFEDFWRQRQQLFETETRTLYPWDLDGR